MFTNADFVNASGVLNDVISDHFPIFACIKKPREKKTYTSILGRTYTSYNKEIFTGLLENENWEELYAVTDPNIIWDLIVDKINTHLSVMCPIKNLKVSTNTPFWLNHHIIEAINDRNKLFKSAKLTGDHNILSNARLARNRTNKLINTARETFIKDTLESNQTDPKKFWRIINNSLIKKQSNNDLVNLNGPDGQRLSFPDSCTYMNDYLVSIGKDLTDQFRNSPAELYCNDYYDGREPMSNDYHITIQDIKLALKEIDTAKGSGIDYLPTFIIKDAFDCLLPQVCHLLNQSLHTGIYPNAWAVAKVTPIPKGGDLRNVKNWRPISVLPLPGKLMEKICTKFLLNELTVNNILSDYQFGFRKGLST